jgi:HAD superfamily hydrolase (TIGR01457 family)
MNIELLMKIRCFLIDLDGTTYLGDQLLPGVGRFIDILRARRIQFLFLTNNSSRHRKDYGERLRTMGLSVADEEIYTSGDATATYLTTTDFRARIYLVGTKALTDVFVEHGLQLVDEDPEVVVLGFDTTITYEKLRRLCDFVREGVPYIATHPDLNCPVEGGYIPDIGAMIAFVESSTGRRPDRIVGKPNRTIIEAILHKSGLQEGELCMVGDRLYTDIALRKHGLITVLVLTGETRQEDLQDSQIQPDYVVKDLEVLSDLLQTLPEAF